MKTFNFQSPRLIIAPTTLALMADNGLAQDSTSSTTADTAPPTVVSQPAPQLSYGVPEVLQLSQAKVGDSTIINYIHNSGNNYGLNAAQIIYLRQQGVSDGVINAMLNQRSLNTQIASTTASSQATDSSAYSAPASTTTTVPAQPTVTYVETVPTSSVYVVPDTQAYYYNNWYYYHAPYYGYYPYYGYGWPYPGVSVSLGWSGYWGGYRGGWHGGGGWHSTGGWHGGGAWHGGGGWHR